MQRFSVRIRGEKILLSDFGSQRVFIGEQMMAQKKNALWLPYNSLPIGSYLLIVIG